MNVSWLLGKMFMEFVEKKEVWRACQVYIHSNTEGRMGGLCFRYFDHSVDPYFFLRLVVWASFFPSSSVHCLSADISFAR